MGEQMSPMPEEVTAEQFDAAQAEVSSPPESPAHNAELMRQLEEDKRRREKRYGDSPATWMNKEQSQ